MLADFLLGVVLIVVFLVLFTAIMHLWWHVPYVPTPMSVVERMINMAQFKGDEHVCDLGAGDGRLLIEAKRRYPGVDAVGFEVVFAIWLLAKIKIFFSRQDVTMKMQNFLKADLSDADVIFLYLSPQFMQILSKKFTAELKPGTRIISHAFQFRDRQPTKVEEFSIPFWGGKHLYLYEW